MFSTGAQIRTHRPVRAGTEEGLKNKQRSGRREGKRREEKALGRPYYRHYRKRIDSNWI